MKEKDFGTMKERIKHFCKTIDIAVSSFEKMCGLSNGAVSSMRKGLGHYKIEAVLNQFPTMNRDWLVFGEGDMLKVSPDQEAIMKRRIISKKLYSFIGSLDLDVPSFEKNCGLPENTLLESEYLDDNALVAIVNKYPKFAELAHIDIIEIEVNQPTPPTPQAAEPPMPYVVTTYNADNTMEYHKISEGCKGIVIPVNLSRNPKCKLSDLSNELIEVSRIMPNFKFLYQVQTLQLEPMVSQGDWLMLDTLDISEVINNEIYLVNSQRFGVMCRVWQWESAERVKLINIDDASDVLTTEVSDINDVCAITSILKNCTTILPFAHTRLGKMLLSNEELLKTQMQHNREMFDEVRKAGARTDMLIELLSKQQK